MSVPLDDVAEYCLAPLVDCPLPLGRRLALEAARELCRDAWIWQWFIPTATLVAGTPDYDLTVTLPEESVIADLFLVTINGIPILPYAKSATQIPTDQAPYNGSPYYGGPAEFAGGCSGQNLTYHRALVTAITLVPNTNNAAGQALNVGMTLMPTIRATCLPEIIESEYIEAVAYYVQSRAMAYPSEKWSNPQLAAVYANEWDERLRQAKTRGQGGNVIPRYRTTPDDFA